MGAYSDALVHSAGRQHAVDGVRLKDLRLNAVWKARCCVPRRDDALDPARRVCDSR